MEKEPNKTVEKGRTFVESFLKEYGHLTLEEVTRALDGTKATNFSEITNCRDMLSYLRDIDKRIRPGKVLCHYTNVKVALAIINGGFWYIGSPKNMNDGLEYSKVDETLWSNLFFASFMIDQKESIGMWSMYAQPWNEGVMISIPSEIFKRWVKEAERVYKANPSTKSTESEFYESPKMVSISAPRVMYYNHMPKEKENLFSCGRANNSILCVDNIYNEMVGYVKDDAWSYENEVRLRVDVDKDLECEAVSLKIPDYVYDAMIITAGPRYKGNIEEDIRNGTSKRIKTAQSVFTGKLNYVYCDRCSELTK